MDQATVAVEPVLVLSGQRKILNVPYSAQLGKGADAHREDCGAACSAMLITAYTGAVISVDTLFFECIASGDIALSAGQLMTVLAQHGVKTEWKAFLTVGDLYTILAAKKPFIALILYGVLVNAGFVEFRNFTGFHFVVVVGADIDTVIIHDPYYSGPSGKNVEIPVDIFMRAWREAGTDPLANPASGAVIPLSPLTERIQVISAVDPSGGTGSTTAVSGTKYRVTASDGLNIRTGQGTNFPKVGKLIFGTEILVEKIDGDWAKLAGADHFVFASWIVKV